MKRWRQFSLASLLAIPLIVALGLYIYKARAVQIELQDRLDFIDRQTFLSEKEINLYKAIVSNEENRPYFTDLELVRNSEAHRLNILRPFEVMVEFNDNTVIVINQSFGKPAFTSFQLDRTHKLGKFIAYRLGEYKSHRIEGNSLLMKFYDVNAHDLDAEFEIVFDDVE